MPIDPLDAGKRFGVKGRWKEFLREFKKKGRGDLGIGMLPKFAIDTMFSNYTDINGFSETIPMLPEPSCRCDWSLVPN